MPGMQSDVPESLRERPRARSGRDLMATDERELAIRAIADTSRYEAPTEGRDLDAECALSVIESIGLIVVKRSQLEAAEQRIKELQDRFLTACESSSEHRHRAESSEIKLIKTEEALASIKGTIDRDGYASPALVAIAEIARQALSEIQEKELEE